ncbi:MAG: polysaccharide lyase 6 family protein [Verrucomicrobiae bacterium]|nr:polysaccharide lyase 6 family protein [Verrucomicrobiae bacterium]
MKHLVLIALLPALSSAMAAVDSLDALNEAMRGAAAGAVIELAGGRHTTTRPIVIEGRRGTPQAPIVLRAAGRGRAVISGAAGFVLRDCEHLVLEGFVFEHDADQPAVLLDNGRHVRVTRNIFRLRERAKPRRMEHWVYVIGARSGHNRIDHNRFERKVNRGSHVFVRGDDTTLTGSRRDRVDHNHFLDVVFAKGENGHETIRTGSNDLGASGRSTFTLIESNLLERCSGETEIMSLKSSDNIVRHNTLLNCFGAICLRLGNRNVVAGNFVLNTDGGPGCGGVKLYGFDHRVFNNYFLGLTGTKHEAPLALIPGTLETPTTDNIGKKFDDLTTVPPTRAWIAFNTWIDCAPLQFGFEKPEGARKHVPTDCVFVNNLVARTKPHKAPLVNLGLVRGLKAHDNLGYAVGAMPRNEWTAWFRWDEPGLRRPQDSPGLWRLTGSSPAINAAVEVATAVDDDVFGRARRDRRDIGAEEFSDETALRGPLTPEAVGPDAP